jgi:hypothetical protein
MTLLTPDQMVKAMLEALENSVADLPENTRDEAKANILNAWGAAMFYSGGPTKPKKETK